MGLIRVGPIDEMTIELNTGRAWHSAYSALTTEQQHELHGIVARALSEARALLIFVVERGHPTQAMPPTAEAD